MTPPSDELRVQRDKRAMMGDGVAYGVMVGSGETYVPAFALAVGLGDVAAGLVATLPLTAGALLQTVTPWAVRRLGSYRRWVVTCARLQAATLLPLVAAALVGRIPLPLLFAVMAAYWGFGMGTSPAWNAWAGALVPRHERTRYFAHRARWGQAALLAGVVGAGMLLDRGAALGRAETAFAALFALAAAARWVSAAYLARQSEPPELARSHAGLSAREAVRGLRGSEAGRVLLYLVAMQMAVQIAAPYFTPYMLGSLELTYARFTVLTATALLARIAVLPLLGRVAHARGTGWLFRVGAVAITPLPVLWLVSEDFAWLLVLQVFAGTAWAALELATLLSFFESLEERGRASILTAFNLVNTLAMAAGALVGAGIFHALDGALPAYAALFGVSTAMRALALVVLRAEPPPAHVPVPEELSMRTLAVRPSLGAIQRPVLPALEAAEPPGPAAELQERSSTGT